MRKKRDRLRRALFGQYLVYFAGSSWSSVKIHTSAAEPTIENGSKAKVSRITREFSQTVAVEDTQPCQHTPNCHNLVPGMSQYSVSQEFSQVESAARNADNLSFSAGPANSTEDFKVERCEYHELSP